MFTGMVVNLELAARKNMKNKCPLRSIDSVGCPTGECLVDGKLAAKWMEGSPKLSCRSIINDAGCKNNKNMP